MTEGHVEIEGINYYTLYELPDSQDQNAPCILLVHALMSNLHMYDATVKSLHQAGFATLRYDHVGHHNTPPPQTATPRVRLTLRLLPEQATCASETGSRNSCTKCTTSFRPALVW